MSILVGNDNPDFSKAINASGNIVDSTLKASGGLNYVGPKVYVGGSPSLFLVGTATVGSATSLLVQVAVYASLTAVVPIASFPFTLGPGANSINMLLPVIGPYAQLEVLGTVSTNAWNLAVYQSAVSTNLPVSTRRGFLTSSNGTSIPPGAQTFPFAFVTPSIVSIFLQFPNVNWFANIADTATSTVLWSGGPTAASNEVNATVALPLDQCQLGIGNGGGAAGTVNWAITC